MRNKYVLTRKDNVKYVFDNLDKLIANALCLSRYNDEDPLKDIAAENFRNAFNFIASSPEVENDHNCMLELHRMLMEGLDSDVNHTLSEEQISELSAMIDQPAKANIEIAIDVMLYILDKRLFSDGDVRVAIMFANKIAIDKGCGIITVNEDDCDTFRQLYKEYQETFSDNFKNWIYKYCVKGPKVEYS